MADIKLIIKISEEDYNILSQTGENTINFGELLTLRKAVRNGFLLPKGNGRLIDADKTISKICGNSCGCHLEECGYDEPCFSVRRIESAPTIIEADKAEKEE